MSGRLLECVCAEINTRHCPVHSTIDPAAKALAEAREAAVAMNESGRRVVDSLHAVVEQVEHQILWVRRADVETLLADVDEIEAALAASWAQRDELLEALRHYGRHVPPCALWVTSGDAGPDGEQHPCTCGFAALTRAAAPPPSTSGDT